MASFQELEMITDNQMTDYIFDDLSAEESQVVESYLLNDEDAFSTSLEMLLLVIEKGFTKPDLLVFLQTARAVEFN